MPITEGKDIREVWDFRLSRGCPYMFDSGPTWVIRVMANRPTKTEKVRVRNDISGAWEEVEVMREVLEEIVTDIATTDPDGSKKVFAILKGIREKYSRDHIELRKPVVKLINESNNTLAAMGAEAAAHRQHGDRAAEMQLRGEMQSYLDAANRRIKQATAQMHDAIERGGN